MAASAATLAAVFSAATMAAPCLPSVAAADPGPKILPIGASTAALAPGPTVPATPESCSLTHGVTHLVPA